MEHHFLFRTAKIQQRVGFACIRAREEKYQQEGEEMTRNLSNKDFGGLGNIEEIASPVVMLSVLNVENVRRKQREEGNFDCFGRAAEGFCDQTCCLHHDNCMYISKLLSGAAERKYMNA